MNGFKVMKNKVLVAAAMAALVGNVQAESNWQCETHGDDFSPCVSIGAGLGMSFLDPDEKTSSWIADSDRDSALSLYINYRFQPRWFVELSYADLGESAVEDRNRLRQLDGAIEYRVPALMFGYYPNVNGLVGDLPVDPFIKLGASAIDSKSNPAAIPFEEQSSVQLAFGLGIDWRFDKHWQLRNQVEVFDVDAVSYNISIAYLFGADK